MKYLILTVNDDEIFYELDKIVSIIFGFAQNLLDRSDMQKNGLKPLETVMAIYFNDNSSVVYSAVGCSMSFD